MSLLDSFERLTSYDIRSFFNLFLSFNDIHYPNIVNYYSGASDIVPAESFKILGTLISEKKKVIDVVTVNSNVLDMYGYWAVLEYIEDIGHTLETANNASKWLRSSITSSGYRGVQMDVVAGQGEGLEAIELNKLMSDAPNDTWVQTAIDNGLREEDYTLHGGYVIKAVFKNNSAIFLASVVDNIDTPEKTYGKDIDRKITIINDDLVVLSYQDTILQCAEILTGLKKGDDPYFIDRGINDKIVVGSNVAAISYPALFRDMATNFATDDSFKTFGITSIKRQGDALYVEFKLETKADQELFKTLVV